MNQICKLIKKRLFIQIVWPQWIIRKSFSRKRFLENHGGIQETFPLFHKISWNRFHFSRKRFHISINFPGINSTFPDSKSTFPGNVSSFPGNKFTFPCGKVETFPSNLMEKLKRFHQGLPGNVSSFPGNDSWNQVLKSKR